MQKEKKFYLKENFIFWFIFLLAFSLRFYQFNKRWSLDFDPSRDVLVAKTALELKKIPLIGAFSSAGPFVWGPVYWWIIMLAYFFAPNYLSAPFFLFALIDLIFVFIMVKIGKLIFGKKKGLLLGLIAAISTSQLYRYHNVNQPTLIPFFGSLIILNFFYYQKTKKSIYSFFAGISLGLALNMHFQALNWFLFPLIIIIINFKKIKRLVIDMFLFFLGVFLPLSPLIYWDYQQNWKNINNVLDYFLIGQYRIYVPNRWLTYLGSYWPEFWSYVFGGHKIIGLFFMAFSFIALGCQFFKKKLSLFIFYLALIFAFIFILNRYYRGIRFEGYMLYFVPFIMIFSAYVFNFLFKINKILFYFLLFCSCFLTLLKDFHLIKQQTRKNQPKEVIRKTIEILKNKKPGKKFIVYNDNYHNPTPSFIASALLTFENLIDEKNGEILGFSTNNNIEAEKIATIEDVGPTVYLYGLSKNWYKPDFDKNNWINVSPQYVCLDNLEWWKVKEFKSTFNLKSFLQDRFNVKKKNAQNNNK